MKPPPRKFSDVIAQRTRTPLVVSLVGPSGTGKTKSGLRLSDGMARLDKDRETFVIDTEGKRALHYSHEHRFRHIDFPPPHAPEDYLAALDYAIDRGAGRILIDSMSHEHDGEGGVLEQHKRELERLGGEPSKSLQAWAVPKQARRKLINRMVSSGADLILCFRATPKIKPVKGKQPLELGWMPVAGREYKFEATINLLLLPGARGVPTLRSSFPGEQEMIKLPGQFEQLFARSPQLSEDIGEQLARWAGGGQVETRDAPISADDLLTRLGACSDQETLDLLSEETKAIWKTIAEAERKRLRTVGEAAKTRVSMLAAQAKSAARAMASSGDDDQDAGFGFDPASDQPTPEAPDSAA